MERTRWRGVRAWSKHQQKRQWWETRRETLIRGERVSVFSSKTIGIRGVVILKVHTYATITNQAEEDEDTSKHGCLSAWISTRESCIRIRESEQDDEESQQDTEAIHDHQQVLDALQSLDGAVSSIRRDPCSDVHHFPTPRSFLFFAIDSWTGENGVPLFLSVCSLRQACNLPAKGLTDVYATLGSSKHKQRKRIGGNRWMVESSSCFKSNFFPRSYSPDDRVLTTSYRNPHLLLKRDFLSKSSKPLGPCFGSGEKTQSVIFYTDVTLITWKGGCVRQADIKIVMDDDQISVSQPLTALNTQNQEMKRKGPVKAVCVCDQIM